MQKIIPLAVTFFALALTACGGGGSGPTPEPLNVSGTWGGSLQTTSGGGLGGVEMTLTQAAAPATDFTGNMTSPLSGTNHPVTGNVNDGTLKTDLSAGNGSVNQDATFSCKGTFTKTSYRGNCETLSGNFNFVLVLGKK